MRVYWRTVTPTLAKQGEAMACSAPVGERPNALQPQETTPIGPRRGLLTVGRRGEEVACGSADPLTHTSRADSPPSSTVCRDLSSSSLPTPVQLLPDRRTPFDTTALTCKAVAPHRPKEPSRKPNQQHVQTAHEAQSWQNYRTVPRATRKNPRDSVRHQSTTLRHAHLRRFPFAAAIHNGLPLSL